MDHGWSYMLGLQFVSSFFGSLAVLGKKIKIEGKLKEIRIEGHKEKFEWEGGEMHLLQVCNKCIRSASLSSSAFPFIFPCSIIVSHYL